MRGASGRPDLAWWQREGGRREGRDRPDGLTRARGCQGEGGAGGGELGGAAWAEGRRAEAVPELCDRGLAAAEEAEELAEAGGPVSEAARDNWLSGDRKAGPRCPPHRPGGGCRERCSPQAVNRPLWGESILLCPPAGGEGRGRGPSSRWGGWRPAPGLRPPPTHLWPLARLQRSRPSTAQAARTQPAAAPTATGRGTAPGDT